MLLFRTHLIFFNEYNFFFDYNTLNQFFINFGIDEGGDAISPTMPNRPSELPLQCRQE